MKCIKFIIDVLRTTVPVSNTYMCNIVICICASRRRSQGMC